jgi:hypothetical protein
MESKARRRPGLREVANAMRKIPEINPLWVSWIGSGRQMTEGRPGANLEVAVASAWRPGSQTSGGEIGQRARTALARRESARPLSPVRSVPNEQQSRRMVTGAYSGGRTGRRPRA